MYHLLRQDLNRSRNAATIFNPSAGPKFHCEQTNHGLRRTFSKKDVLHQSINDLAEMSKSWGDAQWKRRSSESWGDALWKRRSFALRKRQKFSGLVCATEWRLPFPLTSNQKISSIRTRFMFGNPANPQLVYLHMHSTINSPVRPMVSTNAQF